MIVVADAGPLIALARIGHSRLLQLLYPQLHIPPAVRDKVQAVRGQVQSLGAACEKARTNIRDAIKLMVEDRLAVGDPMPPFEMMCVAAS